MNQLWQPHKKSVSPIHLEEMKDMNFLGCGLEHSEQFKREALTVEYLVQ